MTTTVLDWARTEAERWQGSRFGGNVARIVLENAMTGQPERYGVQLDLPANCSGGFAPGYEQAPSLAQAQAAAERMFTAWAARMGLAVLDPASV